MSAIQWKKEFSVGIPSIDEQHKILINYINNLNTAMAAGEANLIISDILVGLADYTKTHFKYEESLFDEHGYPLSESHIKQHQSLLEQVSNLRIRYESDISGSLGLEIMQFLKSWLINHIQKSDKDYSKFLIEKGVR